MKPDQNHYDPDPITILQPGEHPLGWPHRPQGYQHQCREPGPILPMEEENGFRAMIERHPWFWGLAIALAVSGFLSMVTL